MIAFSCRRAAELTSHELNSPMRADQKVELAFHRLICAACRRFGRQLKTIDQSFAEFVEIESDTGVEMLSVEYKNRVKENLKSEMEKGIPGDNRSPED